MPRRRVVCTGAGLALLPTCAAIALGLFLHWRAQFPVRAYERIAIGMSLDEVNAVIGLPPGNYARSIPGRPSHPIFTLIRGEKMREFGDTAAPESAFFPDMFETWIWDDFWIATKFLDGKVVGAALYAKPKPPTLFVRLRRLLGL